jgi:pyruvate dehydrogenase E1 component
LRQFFEVNSHYVVISTLKALADRGEVPAQMVADAIARYGIDADKPAPWTL